MEKAEAYIAKIFAILRGKLPANFNMDALRSAGNPELWRSDPRSALSHALANCKIIAWDKYLEKYPDVAASEQNPIFHFLNDGIFEGRELPVVQKVPENVTGPKVSIIIPNYNNGPYLEKSIGSLIVQTLSDIEIVVVDDASSDESVAIIKNIARRDARIKLIELPSNQSQHMARKAGVTAANGRYIMFLDPDDFFFSIACEIAYNYARSGYDMVCFNTAVQFPLHTSQKERESFLKFLNRGAARSFTASEILPAIYDLRIMNELLWNKIYEASICKAAFAELEDGYLPRGQDNYEALAIQIKARNALKVDEQLYCHTRGTGISTPNKSILSQKRFMTTGDSYVRVERLLKKSGETRYIPWFKTAFLEQSTHAWLEFVDPALCSEYFNAMARQYGIVPLINYLSTHYRHDLVKIGAKFQHYVPRRVNKPIMSLGILYGQLTNGGAERIVWELADMLAQKGHDITVFLEGSHQNDLRLKPPVKVKYLASGDAEHEPGEYSLPALWNILRREPVDVMLCHACYDSNLFWQNMLLKYMGIYTVLFPHSAFFRRLLHPGQRYSLQDHAALARCADRLAVLSRHEELYYSSVGASAKYIPNPVRLPDDGWQPNLEFEKRGHNILVFSRLGDPTKNVNECLDILAHVKHSLQDIKMTFVGSFTDKSAESKFYEKARRLGVFTNIRVTGWLEDATSYIDTAAVLLSTAWHETFPLSIAEAQSRGLPVVMYDLPIALAENNPSIRRVKHGDFQAAAAVIIELLLDESQWRKIAAFAWQNVRKYSSSAYIENIEKLLSNLGHPQELESYPIADYKIVIKTLGHYGGELPPWYGKG